MNKPVEYILTNAPPSRAYSSLRCCLIALSGIFLGSCGTHAERYSTQFYSGPSPEERTVSNLAQSHATPYGPSPAPLQDTSSSTRRAQVFLVANTIPKTQRISAPSSQSDLRSSATGNREPIRTSLNTGVVGTTYRGSSQNQPSIHLLPGGGLVFGYWNSEGKFVRVSKQGNRLDNTRPPLTGGIARTSNSGPLFQNGDVHVQGYWKDDGTFVRSHTRTAPDTSVANNASVRSATATNSDTVYVRGYTRSDGTYVRGHSRRR